jgi:DNA-binding NtrC family response regulator
MSRRALVVDDDRTMVRTLSDVLAITGWQVTPAYSGTDAVEAASSGAFDVVLMDIKMPGMDGVAAFKAMKSQHPDVRVILMTAYAAQDLIAEAEQEGVLQIMSKPVNIPLLIGALTRAVPRRQPVLLIDRDVSFLKTLSDVLRLNGFHAVVTSDLSEAQEILAKERPAAVLLHMHVDAWSTRDAVAALRGVNPAVALIMYSGQSGAASELQETLPVEWIHGYLQKPFDVNRITGMLDALDSHD